MLKFLMGGLSGLWGYVVAGLATVVAIWAALAKAKQSGRDEVITKAAKKEVENVRKANEVERKNAALKPDAKRERLRDRWTRD